MACCSLLAATAGFALVRAGGSLPAPVGGFAWLMVVLIVLGLLIGLRDMWRPLMYRADTRGVTIFYQADRRRFAGSGVFLPWDSVTKLTPGEAYPQGPQRAESEYLGGGLRPRPRVAVPSRAA